MTDPEFQKDIKAMYAAADRCASLRELAPALCEALRRNPAALKGVTYSYRVRANDTGTECAFQLVDGQFSELPTEAKTDVTVTGSEAHLLAIFKRKLSPAGALLLRKIKISGSMAALVRLAEFL